MFDTDTETVPGIAAGARQDICDASTHKAGTTTSPKLHWRFAVPTNPPPRIVTVVSPANAGPDTGHMLVITGNEEKVNCSPDSLKSTPLTDISSVALPAT